MNVVTNNSLSAVPLSTVFCVCRLYAFSVYLFRAHRQCTADWFPFQSWFSVISVSAGGTVVFQWV